MNQYRKVLWAVKSRIPLWSCLYYCPAQLMESTKQHYKKGNRKRTFEWDLEPRFSVSSFSTASVTSYHKLSAWTNPNVLSYSSKCQKSKMRVGDLRRESLSLPFPAFRRPPASCEPLLILLRPLLPSPSPTLTLQLSLCDSIRPILIIQYNFPIPRPLTWSYLQSLFCCVK